MGNGANLQRLHLVGTIMIHQMEEILGAKGFDYQTGSPHHIIGLFRILASDLGCPFLAGQPGFQSYHSSFVIRVVPITRTGRPLPLSQLLQCTDKNCGTEYQKEKVVVKTEIRNPDEQAADSYQQC